uniref:Fork-head domain-containing protein n=1 Tax=Glossina brevipalpis TaxID=37001 RepID=A0A1A9WFX5_9MUSC
MSPDNPTQLLRTHDLRQLRTLPSVTTATVVATAAAAAAASIASNTTTANGLRAAIPSSLPSNATVFSTTNNVTNNGSHSNNNNNSSSSIINNNSNNTTTVSQHHLSNLLAAANSKVNNAANQNLNHNSSANNNNFNGSVTFASANTNTVSSAMPSTSKYVLLQQNRNGLFTPYEGTANTGFPHNAAGTNGLLNAVNASTAGSIVVLATEPVDIHHNNSGNNESQMNAGTTTTTIADNDEELRSLAWLNNSNLIKEIVTTTTTANNVAGVVNKRAIINNNSNSQNNICIVSASNAANNAKTHDLIEELPHQIVNEEQVIATTSVIPSELPNDAQITTLSVSDFQQQFKRFSASDLKDQSISHVYGNLAALGAATMYVGPSGTTTVVEYKAGTTFLPARQLLNGAATNSNASINSTSIVNANGSNNNTNSSFVPSSSTTNHNNTGGGGNTSSNLQATTNNSMPTQTLSVTSCPTSLVSVGSTITVVSSPASSNSSLSTAAVNGGNSPPLSKVGNAATSFFTLSGNQAPIALNYTNTGQVTAASFLAVSSANNSSSLSLTADGHSNSITSNQIPAGYTLVNHPVAAQHVSSSAVTTATTATTTVSMPLQQVLVNSTPHQQPSPLTPSKHNNNSQQSQMANNTPQKQKHPTNVPYDPLVHTHNKPPYSFSSLIFMAIEGSQEKALPVKEIYAWIVQHFPYFKTAPTGWKNSVRHNLSLNKSFVKVEKAPNMGKGSLWRVEQQQRQNLIQALNRSPFFQNSATVEKVGVKSPGNSSAPAVDSYDVIDGGCKSLNTSNASSSHINSRFDPNLFPNLSKAFKDISDVVPDVPDDEYPSDYSTTTKSQNQNNATTKYSYNSNNHPQHNGNVINAGQVSSTISAGSVMATFSNYESIERLARDCGAESIDDVNAATAMLALKHGPKVFSGTFQNGAPVITSSPSEDHTYSAGGGGVGGGSSSGAGSGTSTPLINGSSSLIINGSAHTPGLSCMDNQSNCASSDAAYESSEECHNITPEELEDQQRHRDGVDALLSLSLSSGIDTGSNTTQSSQNSSLNSNSPSKRPPSTSVEEEHISTMDNNSNYHLIQPHNISKMALLSTAANVAFAAVNGNNGSGRYANSTQSTMLDESYNAPGYYGNQNNSNNGNGIATNGNYHHSAAGGNGNLTGGLHHHYQNHSHHNHNSSYSLHSTTTIGGNKKPKPLRSLRTKIKRKAPWMR